MKNKTTRRSGKSKALSPKNITEGFYWVRFLNKWRIVEVLPDSGLPTHTEFNDIGFDPDDPNQLYIYECGISWQFPLSNYLKVYEDSVWVRAEPPK